MALPIKGHFGLRPAWTKWPLVPSTLAAPDGLSGFGIPFHSITHSSPNPVTSVCSSSLQVLLGGHGGCRIPEPLQGKPGGELRKTKVETLSPSW